MSENLTTINFSPDAHKKYSLKVPKGYEAKGYEVTVEKERRYFYSDSSYIYFTNFSITPNYENIESLGDSILQFRFQNEELTKSVNQILGKEVIKVLPDTFELSGIDNHSLYWKDIKAGQNSVGYLNVPEERKELFDRSLKTLRIRK